MIKKGLLADQMCWLQGAVILNFHYWIYCHGLALFHSYWITLPLSLSDIPSSPSSFFFFQVIELLKLLSFIVKHIFSACVLK